MKENTVIEKLCKDVDDPELRTLGLKIEELGEKNLCKSRPLNIIAEEDEYLSHAFGQRFRKSFLDLSRRI